MKNNFKDQCDVCKKFKSLCGYENQCLCLDCLIKKIIEKGEIDMDGIERIKLLSSEVTNKPLLKVVNYLITRNDMNEKYLNEEKSLKQMVNYIKNEVRKTATDGWNCLDDEDVYNLAIHYWDETNESLKIKAVKEPKKEEIVEEQTPKKKQSKQWVAEGQLTLF